MPRRSAVREAEPCTREGCATGTSAAKEPMQASGGKEPVETNEEKFRCPCVGPIEVDSWGFVGPINLGSLLECVL